MSGIRSTISYRRSFFNKKILLLIMLISFVMNPVCAPTIGTADANKEFTDIRSNDWFYPTVMKLVNSGAISGFPDRTFRPNSPITRAEFVKVLIDALKMPIITGYYYTDTKDHWASDYISTAIVKGIVSENAANNVFMPDQSINRLDMTRMMLSALNVESVEKESPFVDISDEAATSAFSECLVMGSMDNGNRYFFPYEDATRAEVSAVIIRAVEYKKNPGAYKKKELYEMLVKPSAVMARVINNTKLYSYCSLSSKTIGALEPGTKVEIIYGISAKWFNISTGNKTGWIQRSALYIPADPPTNTSRMTAEQMEGYINYKGFKSSSPYFVWVDIDRQMTNVFSGTQGKWKLNKTMKCSTGKNETPSIRGLFTISQRGKSFYNPMYGSGAKYWVRYNNDYLFHSIAFDKYGNIKDPTLGKRASTGCIRMSVEDSSWFYNYIPKGTAVWVY